MRTLSLLLQAVSCVFITGALAGCGTSDPVCSSPVVSIEPATATVSYSSKDNQQKFSLRKSSASPGCAVPASLQIPTNWVVSDPAHATISNSLDTSNGVATCTGASNEPIQISLKGSSIQPASLSCQ